MGTSKIRLESRCRQLAPDSTTVPRILLGPNTNRSNPDFELFIGKPPDRVLTEEALDPDDNFLIAICESGSAKSARNPRLGEAGRNGGKDGEMRGIR